MIDELLSEQRRYEVTAGDIQAHAPPTPPRQEKRRRRRARARVRPDTGPGAKAP